MQHDKSLEQDLSAIYHAIQKRENVIKALNNITDKAKTPKHRQISRILFCSSAIVIALSYIFMQLNQPSSTNIIIVATTGILAGYLLMFISVVIDFFSLKKDVSLLMKNPLSLLFDGFRQTIDSDVTFIQTLQEYSTRSLMIAKNRLRSQSTIVQHRLRSLVGPLSNLGLLPSLLAVSITFFKQEYHQVTIHMSIVFFVLYMIVLRASTELPRLQFYVQMLEDEIAIRS